MAIDGLVFLDSVPPERRMQLRALWRRESDFSDVGREYRETLNEAEAAFVRELDRQYDMFMNHMTALPDQGLPAKTE